MFKQRYRRHTKEANKNFKMTNNLKLRADLTLKKKNLLKLKTQQ